MTALDSVLRRLGLLWERTHLISAGTVATPGVRAAWTRDLLPVGAHPVAAGELVELYVTLEDDRPVAALPEIRLDVLEFDWLFTGGFDDPVVSVKTESADPPDGDFELLERQLSEDEAAADRTVADAVADYRARHADDFERGILVVRETGPPPTGRTHVVGWWRAQWVEDSDPSLYFVADVDGVRDSSTVPLTVSPPAAGANVRMVGRVLEDAVADPALAQPVPRGQVTLGGRTTSTGRDGTYLADARLPAGASTLRVSRSGVDDRTLAVQVTPAPDGSVAVVVTDPAAGGTELHRGTVAARADPQSVHLVELDVRVRVHTVRGVVRWPETRRAADAVRPLTLRGRRVCALPLAPGATAPQRPSSTREWAELAARPDVLRSVRPGRGGRDEPTDADGAFELPFVDLTSDGAYLLWVESADPRNPGRTLPEVLVRTVATPRMRQMSGDHANTLDRDDRRIVDSTVNLLSGPVTGAPDVLRVDAAARLLRRPGRIDPAGIDATPPTGTEDLAIDPATRRVAGLTLESLPLVPVFEPDDERSPAVRSLLRRWRAALAAALPRGHLVADVRWLLDARRADPYGGGFDATSTCELLEQTLLSQPALTRAQIDAPGWNWWRIDALSLADYSDARITPNGPFAGRGLTTDLVPVLHPALPRLTGLFARRRVVLSAGHGLFSEPPLAAAGAAGVAQQLSPRGGWNLRAGEDENAGVIVIELARAIRANGAVVVASRELDDMTASGLVQTGQSAFARAVHPDFPRLWQQNAYYWIADQWDPTTVNPIVRNTVLGNTTASNNAINPNDMQKNVDGNRAKIELLRRVATADGVDAFVAVHSNGGAAGARGTLALYLDIRPQQNSPAPTAAGYQETNTLGQRFADLVRTALIAALNTDDDRTVSVFENNNRVGELQQTVSHHRIAGLAGLAARAVRSAAPGAVGGPATVPVAFPRVRGRDIPVGYAEVAYQSDPDDGRLLAQRWFRFAAAVALAGATDAIVGEHPEALTADDVAALLRAVFGPTPEVAALPGGAVGLAVADIGAAITAVTAVTAVATPASLPAQPQLGPVVTAVHAARDVATRGQLVGRLFTALARAAGYDVDDATQDDAVARAALGPLLRAAGADEPAPDAVPAIADLPRPTAALTRADAATLLAAGAGLRPATLGTVTAPVGGVTLLAGLNPEAPEAFLTLGALDRAVTEAATLRPRDVWHAVAARIVDARDVPLAGAAPRVVPGQDVRIAVDLAGTAWPGTADGVRLLLTVGAMPVGSLACALRSADRLLSAVWTVVPPPGAGGLDVTARVTRPDGSTMDLATVTATVTFAGGTP